MRAVSYESTMLRTFNSFPPLKWPTHGVTAMPFRQKQQTTPYWGYT